MMTDVDLQRQHAREADAAHLAEVDRRGYSCPCKVCSVAWMEARGLDPFPPEWGVWIAGAWHYDRKPFPGARLHRAGGGR